MDLTSPIRSVIPSVHGLVLAALARTDRPLSGRGLAGALDGQASPRRVNQVLEELVRAGLALREKHPPAYLYRLNREHLAATAIVALADLRSLLLDRLGELVDGWTLRAEAVWLFGSAARGDGGPDSDIDLLVIRPDDVPADNPRWLEQLGELERRVAVCTGNDCRVMELDRAMIATMVRTGERLVDELRRDAIGIQGPSPHQVLVDRPRHVGP